MVPVGKLKISSPIKRCENRHECKGKTLQQQQKNLDCVKLRKGKSEWEREREREREREW
jgi:hypothetical protein